MSNPYRITLQNYQRNLHVRESCLSFVSTVDLVLCVTEHASHPIRIDIVVAVFTVVSIQEILHFSTYSSTSL